MIDTDYFLVLFLWGATLAALLVRAWRGRPVAGVALAYWINLALIHLISGIIQSFPWHKSPLREETILGFNLTGYAMVGLLIGNLFLAPLLVAPPAARRPRSPAGEGPRRLAIVCIWFGLCSAFVLQRLLGSLPTVSAIVSGGLPLMAAGFVLLWWGYWKEGQKGKAWKVLAAAAFIPALTLGLSGFLGFGVAVWLIIAAFVAVHYRPRRTIIWGGLCCMFLGLSLYPTYMKVRDQIRATVWGGADVEERLDVGSRLFTEWEWFDSEKSAHLSAIESRLNQNVLVGKAVRRASQGTVEFAHGETIWNSVVALVPRAIWPDKPSWAGSGNLVSRFTGLYFARGTSVGLGHVMELFVNFGEMGVLIGYIVLGMLLGVIDLVAGRCLAEGNWERFALWYVAGLSMLQVGGNFTELTAAMAGAVILCLFASRVLLGPARRPPLASAPAAQETVEAERSTACT